jgi:hypothetical protein
VLEEEEKEEEEKQDEEDCSDRYAELTDWYPATASKSAKREHLSKPQIIQSIVLISTFRHTSTNVQRTTSSSQWLID